jgi:hypothetical protein
MSSLPVRYYKITNNPLPHSRATWYRWASLGLVKLHRFAGGTFVDSVTIDDIVSGKIKLPNHVARLTPLKPKKRLGRPRKHAAE